MIEVNHLTKRYGDHTAVSDLSFTIEKGQIYGFLGPNGAGKSTTMNIMTGCLAASEGEVKIDGHDIFEEPIEAKKRIGYLPELPPLYLDSTPREYLTFVARAKGMKEKEIKAEIERVMEKTQITEMAERVMKHLSKGYKQRVGIAQAILGNPDVIILDEPTVGLDPKQIIEIRELIRELGADHTVILSSHILSEVQAVCQTILIIAKGKLVACDTPDNLERLFAGTCAVELTAEAAPEACEELLDGITGVKSVTCQENGTVTMASVEVESDDETAVCREIFFAFAKAGLAILRMTGTRASLEDIFLELTEKESPAEPVQQEEAPVEEAAAEPEEKEDAEA